MVMVLNPIWLVLLRREETHKVTTETKIKVLPLEAKTCQELQFLGDKGCYVAQAGLEFVILLGSHLSAGVTGMSHPAWLRAVLIRIASFSIRLPVSSMRNHWNSMYMETQQSMS